MTTPREELAVRQAALLRALLGQGPPPDGFDPGRVDVEAAALRAKRRRVLRRLLAPEVPEALGPELGAHLDRWIRARPRRIGTGFSDDARAFTAEMRRAGLLPRRRRWWARTR